MTNIIVAVNVIFAVCLDRREVFWSIFQQEIDLLQGQRGKSPVPSLIQMILGEDIEEPTKFHCHLKFECSSLKQAEDALKEYPIFLNPTSDKWNTLVPSKILQEDPEICTWIVAESRSYAPNPKLNNQKQEPLFCLNANLYIQPEHREEFLRVLENARSHSIQEPLCVEYQYGPSILDPNTFHVHQAYRGGNGGKEGFDVHAKTPHYQVWNDFVKKEPFRKDPEGFLFRAPCTTTFYSFSKPHNYSPSGVLAP